MDRTQILLVGLPLFLFFSDIFNLFAPPPPSKPTTTHHHHHHHHNPNPNPIPHPQQSHIQQPLDFPTQRQSGIGAIGIGNTVSIDFCSSCSYKGTAVTIKNMLESSFPGINVVMANYPPPLPKRILSKIVPVVQTGVIIALTAGDQIFPRLGITPPQLYYSLRANKFRSIASTWLLANFVQSFLQSSGAFEVYCNGDLCLMIDEADRILEANFEDEMKQIINILPKNRQTALFSATQTKKVEDLARLSFQTTPIYVDVDDGRKKVTVEGLQQGYVVVPCAKRFVVLYSFLRRYQSKKVMVFFSSCNSVKFHTDLLKFAGLECFNIHGKQKQSARTTTFFSFCKAEKGILLCTDVAARGLDIPDVDWIVQFDPPDEPKEYIHRVGRTARGEGGKGNALLFLIPEELQFLRYLKAAKIPVKEYQFDNKKLANVQSQLEKLVAGIYHLNSLAKDAYRSYILAYNSHSMKEIFNVHRLDLQAVATSFCFSNPPKINLNIDSSAAKHKKIRKVEGRRR